MPDRRPKKLTVSVQVLVLSILAGALILTTAVLATIVYGDLYRTILSGFDEKLQALSNLAAVFIDGDDHERIVQERQIHGLAHDPGSDRWYAYDARFKRMVTINPASGTASDLPYKMDRALIAVTWHAGRGLLYGLDEQKGELVRVQPETGETVAVGKLSHPFQTLAVQPETGRLYAAGPVLAQLDLNSAHATVLQSALPLAPTGMAFGPDGKLYLLAGATGEVFVASSPSAPPKVMVQLLAKPAPDSVEATEVEDRERVTLPARGLAWEEDSQRLLTAAGRLVSFDPATGDSSGKPTAHGFRDESNPLYQKYIVPMRRVMKELDVTFYYTFVLGGKKDIVYVLDATEGEDFTPIGYEEELPEDNKIGVKQAMFDGTVFVSGILPYETWGLLKVSSSPIESSEYRVGMAGTDINITVINKKTRTALIKVAGIGTATLLLAGFVAFYLSERLSKPLNNLKDGALRVAAGNYSYRLKPGNLRELAELAGIFNDISNRLELTTTNLNRTNLEFERQRCQQEVAKLIFQRDRRLYGQDERFQAGWLEDAQLSKDGSGLFTNQGRALVWLSRPFNNTFEAMRFRQDLQQYLHGRATRGIKSWLGLNEEVHGLFGRDLRAVIALDAAKRALHIYTWELLGFATDTEKGHPKALQGSGLITHTLAPGQEFFFASAVWMSRARFAAWAQECPAVGARLHLENWVRQEAAKLDQAMLGMVIRLGVEPEGAGT